MVQRESFSLEEAEAWVGRAMDDSGEDRKYAILVEGHERAGRLHRPLRPLPPDRRPSWGR